MTRYRGMGLATRGQGITAAAPGKKLSKGKGYKDGGMIIGPNGMVKAPKVTDEDANAAPTIADSNGMKRGGIAKRGKGYKKGGMILGPTKQHHHYASPEMNPKTAAPQGAAAGGYPVPDEGFMGSAPGAVQKGTIEPQPSRGFKRGGPVHKDNEDLGGDNDTYESKPYGETIMGKTGRMEAHKSQSLAPEFEVAEKKNTRFQRGGLAAKKEASGLHRRGDARYADGGPVRMHKEYAMTGKAPGVGGAGGEKEIRGKTGGKNSYGRGPGTVPRGDLKPKRGGAS